MTEPRTHTRRQFVRGALRLGAGAAVLGALDPRRAAPARASPDRPAPVQVLMADLSDTTAADFARGQGRGVALVATGGRAGLRATAACRPALGHRGRRRRGRRRRGADER